jgi:hypothetical protein
MISVVSLLESLDLVNAIIVSYAQLCLRITVVRYSLSLHVSQDTPNNLDVICNLTVN